MHEYYRVQCKSMSKKAWAVVLVIMLLLAGLLVLAPTLYSYRATSQARYDLAYMSNVNDVPYNRVAIVFGAGITPDGRPTPYLRNRILTAVTLYNAGRVDKILMTGDNSTLNHNEPVAMKRSAIRNGVPAKDVVVDYAGFDTYDSCYRAKAIFGVTSATLVTQGYHLPRAMVTCKGVGVNNIGVEAQSQGRDYTLNYLIREVLSTDKMVFELLTDSKPTVLGKPEPIE